MNDKKVKQLAFSDKVTPEAREMYSRVRGVDVETLKDVAKFEHPDWFKAGGQYHAFADDMEPNTELTGMVPALDEFRGLAIPTDESAQAVNVPSNAGLGGEEVAPGKEDAAGTKEAKEPAEGVDESSAEEKTEHGKLVESIKKHLAMEGIDKAVKADGEKILAKLEEALKLEELAYEWLEKLKPAATAPVEGAKEEKETQPQSA